jgi:tetratricopeptide (TPR) repeat protein
MKRKKELAVIDSEALTGQIRRRRLIVCLVLALATCAVYSPALTFDFINLDDQVYVYDNARIQAGITPEGILWAFTALDANFWHPLTWLSHMLDWQLFGPNPSGHHAMSLLFHVANTLLLFLAFVRMTNRLWESASVAALFALHPLHVQSVAWVSERKDVLSTFFFMLTLLLYSRYVAIRTVSRYLLVLLSYILGLMAKPMLVTVPFVLLLLDFWPLRRFGDGGLRWETMKPLILEKIPFFALALSAGLLAILAQAKGDTLASMDVVPLAMRLSNAAVAIVLYLWQTVWPIKLAVYYPFQPVPATATIGAVLLIAALTVLAVSSSRRHPYIPVGWFWYVGTLLPVSGIIQVGSHAMADRYTYIPLIGIFIVAAWGVQEMLSRIGITHFPSSAKQGWERRRVIFAFVGGILMLVLMTVTVFQLQFWRDSESLFRRALAVTGSNDVAEDNLGLALAKRGAFNDALSHFMRAMELRPADAEIVFSVGNTMAGLNREAEAELYFKKAIQMNPRLEMARINLGVLLVQQGRFDEAVRQLQAALELNRYNAAAHLNLALAFTKMGRKDEAAAHLETALRVAPENVLIRAKVAQVYWIMGRMGRAIEENERLRRMDGKLADDLTRWMSEQSATQQKAVR